ncbi:MAG: hypothetical protein R2867_46890 [Caldilineaceae bacterium]
MRPAYLYSRLRPDLIGETWQSLEQVALSGFEGLLNHFQAEIRITDTAQAASTITYFFNMMLLGKLLHHEWGSWHILQGEELFAKELADFAYRYLTNGESATDATERKS